MGKAKRAAKTKAEKSDDEVENVGQNTDIKQADNDAKPKVNKKKQKPTQKQDNDASQEKPKLTQKQDNDASQEKPKEENGVKPKSEPSSKPNKKDDEAGNESGGEEAAKKKKKDKKKKGKEKEEKKEDDKKKRKGPGKAALLAMQETLKKIQEEEEEARRQEEERIRKIEEEERKRQEKLEYEKRKKEIEKQKKKERLQRAKAEGRYLTPKQKAERARAQAMLDALRAQGLELPEKSGEKPTKGSRVIQPKGKKPKPSDNISGQVNDEQETTDEQKVEVEILDEKEVGIEDDDDVEEEDDVKDTWDDGSEQEDAEDDSEEKPEEDEESEGEDEESEGEEDDDESGSSSSEEYHKTDAEKRREKALERIEKRKAEAVKKMSTDVLRAPVVCVLGHVDTGKTKILDKLRRTHVQEGEAGGITQQIGATNVPQEAIKMQSRMVKGLRDFELKLPGMLIIDTPGHESFSNLRSRGSSLCDIAILVIDIMHGLEPQTIESINLLKKGKTPFVVALNKIDRLYDWATDKNKDVEDLIKLQAKNTQQEFKERSDKAILELAEQGLNAKLFYDNDNPREYISLVPTSAVTGEGMGNLIGLLAQVTQSMLQKRLAYSEDLQAVVLEVKTIPGHGTTVDVILVNGTLHVGDTIVLAGTDGPIVTQIRALLMPQPLKELRVKNSYFEPKEVRGAQGVKIVAKELEKVVAGLNLHVAEHPDEVEIMKELAVKEFKSVMSTIKLSERGVFVQASTLGSLEALLEFLRTSEIPYSGVRIGPVTKKAVMKASIMLEHETMYAVILAFDVKIERDAQELADNLGVKIFQADIIYHLFDSFVKYQSELKAKRKEEFKFVAVFPCKLKILPQFIFNSRDPIVAGVSVEAGIVKEGTPICVKAKESGFVDLGVVSTIEVNHKPIPEARKGQEVCIKIDPIPGEAPKMIGRHFEETDLLLSKISRESIDACKNYFRDDLLKSDWQLMIELKKLFSIL